MESLQERHYCPTEAGVRDRLPRFISGVLQPGSSKDMIAIVHFTSDMTLANLQPGSSNDMIAITRFTSDMTHTCLFMQCTAQTPRDMWEKLKRVFLRAEIKQMLQVAEELKVAEEDEEEEEEEEEEEGDSLLHWEMKTSCRY